MAPPTADFLLTGGPVSFGTCSATAPFLLSGSPGGLPSPWWAPVMSGPSRLPLRAACGRPWPASSGGRLACLRHVGGTMPAWGVAPWRITRLLW